MRERIAAWFVTTPIPPTPSRSLDNFSGDFEVQTLDVFRGLITDSDHKARMDMRFYAEDIDGAMRSANRAGGRLLSPRRVSRDQKGG